MVYLFSRYFVFNALIPKWACNLFWFEVLGYVETFSGLKVGVYERVLRFRAGTGIGISLGLPSGRFSHAFFRSYFRFRFNLRCRFS